MKVHVTIGKDNQQVKGKLTSSEGSGPQEAPPQAAFKRFPRKLRIKALKPDGNLVDFLQYMMRRCQLCVL